MSGQPETLPTVQAGPPPALPPAVVAAPQAAAPVAITPVAAAPAAAARPIAPARPRFSAADTQASLGRVVRTALLEIRLNLLTAAPWVVGIILAVLGVLGVVTAPDKTSLLLSWVIASDQGPLAMILLLFLASALANRPNRYDMTELLDSKVVASEELIFGRWIGMVVAVLVSLAVQVGAVMIAQWVAPGGTRPDPFPYLLGVSRMLPAVLFFCTLAFTLVTVTRILVLGAGLTALLWFIFFAGQEFYPTFLRLELSQNAGVFYGLNAAGMMAMLALYRGRRRAKKAPISYALGIGAGALLLVTGLHAGWLALALPNKEHVKATWERLREGRRGKADPVPNFAWTDLHGKRISIADYQGQPLLLVFLQPKDPKLAPTLRTLESLKRDLAPDGLRVLGVFLSEDLNAARDVQRILHTSLDLVTDWGQLAGAYDPKHPGSAASGAFSVPRTPDALFIGDDGLIWARELTLDEAQLDVTKEKLRAMAQGNRPEEPGGGGGLPDGIPGGPPQ